MGEYYDREKFTSGGAGGPHRDRPKPPPFSGPNRGANGWGGPGTPPPGRPRRPTPPPPTGRRPPKSGNELNWLLFILLMIFFWPAGLAYLFYKLFVDQKASNGLNDFIRSVEILFGSKLQKEGKADFTQEAAEVRDEGPSAAYEGAAQPENGGAQPENGAGAESPQQEAEAPKAAAKSAQKKDGKKSRKKSAASKANSLSTGGATALRIIGACLLFGGIVALADEVDSLLYGFLFLEDLVAAALITLAGGGMFFFGQRKARDVRRAKKYILAIGDEESMELDEIAKRVGRSRKRVVRDLQRLIDRGLMGDDAYLDLELGYFMRFGAKVEQAPKETPPPESAQAEESPYRKILADIRRANDRIDDQVLSDKIDRLEEITRRIFQEVEEHPEKRDSIHTFFDYYLPTTQKLLDTYADFEEAGVEGENLREAKLRIERTMDSIVEGFERQLDSLFKADVMDVESDIRVMESMLRRDSASAAKDFGYHRTDKKDDQQQTGAEG